MVKEKTHAKPQANKKTNISMIMIYELNMGEFRYEHEYCNEYDDAYDVNLFVAMA